MAQKMGAPIQGFVAATNANRTIPDWIATGEYNARPSIATLSNAMDVGAPSNYERMAAMFSLDEIRQNMASYWLDDAGTKEAIRSCHRRTGYILDPHGAVAWQAWDDIHRGAMSRLADGITGDYNQPGLTPNLPSWSQKILDREAIGLVLETAHPSKFGDIVANVVGREPPLPDRLERVLLLPDRSQPMTADYDSFRQWLMENL